MSGNTSIFTSVFRGIEPDALEALRHFADLRSYPIQTRLVTQGQIENTFYIVVEGQVAIVQTLENGEERLLAVVGPRQYFGELGLLDDTPRMANCVAITPVKVLEITSEAFSEVLAASPAVARSLIQRVVNLLRETDRLAIEDLTVKNRQLEQAYLKLQAAQDELVRMERLEHELEIAANVQRSLLPPSLPEVPAYHFAAFLQPARQVGGDVYDVIVLDDEHVGLLLADVADKSVQAALFMAVTRTLFMVESRRSLSPAEVTQAVHHGLLNVASRADIFVTAFYGVLHRPSRRLRYVIAGQEKPLIARLGNGAAPVVESLPGRGRFLGMLPNLNLDEYAIQLRPHDLLLLFSDGLTDATNSRGEQFRYDRLHAFMVDHFYLDVKELVARLAAQVQEWSGAEQAFDDLTLLAVKVLPEEQY
jgi:phosphoserine phosphatase RsbU/P